LHSGAFQAQVNAADSGKQTAESHGRFTDPSAELAIGAIQHE
jgi:hypothetical protein